MIRKWIDEDHYECIFLATEDADIYLLSRCESFMCSGQCNGWDVVMQLNEGEFLRSYKFSVGIEGNSPTKKN